MRMQAGVERDVEKSAKKGRPHESGTEPVHHYESLVRGIEFRIMWQVERAGVEIRLR